MPTRRRLLSLAGCPALPAIARRRTVLRLECYVPLGIPMGIPEGDGPGAAHWRAALARRIERWSDGALQVLPDAAAPGSAPPPPDAEAIHATLGRLAFGPAALDGAAELLGGFAFGMGARDLASWAMTPEGRRLRERSLGVRGLRALPCGVLAMPGGLWSPAPLGAAALPGRAVLCRGGGIMAGAWARLGARVVRRPLGSGDAGAHGSRAAGAHAPPDAAAHAPPDADTPGSHDPGTHESPDAATHQSHDETLTPRHAAAAPPWRFQALFFPTGRLLDLGFDATAFDRLPRATRRGLEAACAAALADTVAMLPRGHPDGSCRTAPLLPDGMPAALAAAAATALREEAGRAVGPSLLAGHAAARIAGLYG